MWTVDVIQNNSYIPLLATLCVFLPLLHDLRQMSSERFLKPTVVRDFCGVKMSLHYTTKTLLGGARSHKLLPFLTCNARQLL